MRCPTLRHTMTPAAQPLTRAHDDSADPGTTALTLCGRPGGGAGGVGGGVSAETGEAGVALGETLGGAAVGELTRSP